MKGKVCLTYARPAEELNDIEDFVVACLDEDEAAEQELAEGGVRQKQGRCRKASAAGEGGGAGGRKTKAAMQPVAAPMRPARRGAGAAAINNASHCYPYHR